MELEKRLVELQQLSDWLREENERRAAQIHHLEEQSCSLRKAFEEKEEQIIKLEDEASMMKRTEERYKEKYENLIKELESEKRKRREEVGTVRIKSLQLGVDARKLEIDLEAERRASRELKVEVEARKSEMKQKEGVITTLIRKNEVLEREKTRVEDRIVKLRPISSAMEAQTGRLEEANRKVSELVERVRVLEREKGDVEAKCCKIENDKCAEIKGILREKVVLEDEKRRVMADMIHMKVGMEQLVQRTGVFDREKSEMEADFFRMRKEMSEEIDMISNEKMSLEAEKKRMEERLTMEAQRIEVFESGKREMEAEFLRMRTEMNNGIVKILSENKTLEVERKRMEEKTAMEVQGNDILEREIEAMKVETSKALEAGKRRVEEEKEKTLELVQRIEILEREKAEMEANVLMAKKDKENEPRVKVALMSRRIEEAKRRITELHRRVEALESTKDAMKAELIKVYRGKGMEIKRILKEKTDVEAGKRTMEEDKKKIMGLVSRIEAFKREKGETEAEIREAAERISMVKEEAEKKVSELAHRIGVLESEKQGLMAANMEKDEVIKLLEKENGKFYAQKAELEDEISGDASIQNQGCSYVNIDANPVKRPRKIMRVG